MAAAALSLLISTASADTTPAKPHPSSKTHSAKGAAKKTSTKNASSHSYSKKSAKSAKSSHKKARGQQAMDSARAREIQAALIREHYMDGEPSGSWDTRSKTAMQKFQADHGWQSKVVPDSRALIVLGLGPDHTNLINPDTAATGPRPGGGPAQNQR